MEFQSGDGAQKPVKLLHLKAPASSYVTFNNKGAGEALSTWSLQITDEQGKSQSFGPYTEDEVRIPGKVILGSRPEGDFKVKMIGQTKSGVVEMKLLYMLYFGHRLKQKKVSDIVSFMNLINQKLLPSMKNI
jgi:hypothetical protein